MRLKRQQGTNDFTINDFILPSASCSVVPVIKRNTPARACRMIDNAAENIFSLGILSLLSSFLSTGELIETAAKSQIFMSIRTLGSKHV